MSEQSPPSEHDQLAHLVAVEIPALEAERDAAAGLAERVMADRDRLAAELERVKAALREIAVTAEGEADADLAAFARAVLARAAVADGANEEEK